MCMLDPDPVKTLDLLPPQLPGTAEVRGWRTRLHPAGAGPDGALNSKYTQLSLDPSLLRNYSLIDEERRTLSLMAEV